MGKNGALDARLAAAAAFVRNGAVFADIGTDHAYLPIALYKAGVIRRGLAADIAAGPIARAREHIAACGLSDVIDTLQTDGLNDVQRYTPTDIALCGMGGELIARIISEAPFVHDPAIRLILQPMTMQPYLRRWLCEHGFSIEREALACAAGKLYPILQVSYSGMTTTLSDTEALLGAWNLAHRAEIELFPVFLQSKLESQRAASAGRRSAGKESPEDAALLAELEQLADEYKI